MRISSTIRRMVRLSCVQHAMETAIAALPPDAAIPVPADLMHQLRTAIESTAQPWDEALWHLVHVQTQEGDRPLLHFS